MLGLAVGIDYALFITSRYRQYLADGMDGEEAAGRAAGTAGSAVVFAGATVVIALAGLAVAGVPFLTVMGLAAAATVALAVLVSLTLLPAVLGFAGVRVLPRARRTQDSAPSSAGTGTAFGFRWGLDPRHGCASPSSSWASWASAHSPSPYRTCVWPCPTRAPRRPVHPTARPTT
ncbi:hypothetical protein SMICM304S_10084 [Streptomyces microflavus]